MNPTKPLVMIPEPSSPVEPGSDAFTQHYYHAVATGVRLGILPPKPPGMDCEHAGLVAGRDGWRTWRRCGRACCSPGCRRRWARRRAGAFRRGLADRPPTVFGVIRSPVRPLGRAGVLAFRESRRRMLRAVRRLVPDLEWSWHAHRGGRAGCYHEHLNARSRSPAAEVCEAVRSAAEGVGLVATARPVRDWAAAVVYAFGAGRGQKEPPTPDGFRGLPLYGTSGGFLSGSVAELLKRPSPGEPPQPVAPPHRTRKATGGKNVRAKLEPRVVYIARLLCNFRGMTVADVADLFGAKAETLRSAVRGITHGRVFVPRRPARRPGGARAGGPKPSPADQPRPAREAAAGFLLDNLAGGERPAAEVIDLARSGGVSLRTLKRAAAALGVVVRKAGLRGWRWSLPGEGCQPGPLGTLQRMPTGTGVGTLRDGDAAGAADGPPGADPDHSSPAVVPDVPAPATSEGTGEGDAAAEAERLWAGDRTLCPATGAGFDVGDAAEPAGELSDLATAFLYGAGDPF